MMPTGTAAGAPQLITPAGAVNTTNPITVTAVATDTSCPNLRFMVSSYSFNVDAATQYQGGTCANIRAGATITFNGAYLTQTAGVFYVPQLSFVTSTPPAPTPTVVPVQTELTITSLGSGLCPELQFLMNAYAFNVSTATQYTGGTCADLKAGARVAIVGTKSSAESFVRLTSVTFKTASTPPVAPPIVADVTVSSLVSGTTCPALSFMVGPYTVAVSLTTTFDGGACSGIAPGAALSLTATRLGDGSIAAVNIQFKNPPATASGRPVDGEGVITSVSGTTTCPTAQFYIGPYLIKADASTQYVGGACSDLKPGLRVGVKGTLASDSSVSASVLTVTPGSSPQPQAEGEGVVTALVDGTACPALQMKIGEYTISLTASTQFVGGSCADVAIGKRLGVRGTMTGDKAATATMITFRN
jgi:Domain of unknown function (DUF5666)